MNRLVFKISSAFFLMILFIFSILGLSANYFIEAQFRQYALERTMTDSTAISEQLSAAYTQSQGNWEMGTLEGIGVSAMAHGLMIRVINGSGDVLWDAMSHNEGFCSAMLMQMEMNMLEQNATFQGGYEEKDYPIQSNGQTVGQVIVGYYGPYFYSDDDVKYIDALQNLLFAAGLLSLFLSVALGIFVARRISRPIVSVIDGAHQISQGRYSNPIVTNSKTDEIVDLTRTINQLGETLNNQEALRKRLTSDVAHELRTPVTVLQSHLELMIEGVWQPDPDKLRKLYDETQRLGRLVNDLGKIQALEGENLKLNPADTNIYSLLKEVAAMMKSEFDKKGIYFECIGQSFTAHVDADKIKQILVNLLTNALRYTMTGGNVALRFAEHSVNGHKNHFQLIVEDTGIGIPEKDLPYIFERFYRVDPSRTKASGGSGIGLSITKALVEAHGGTIYVESTVGKGSVFICELPVK